MQVVGVTGRSGSGKSELTRYFASLGYPTMDGDAVSREVMGPGSPCVAALVEAFGAGILFPDGSLDRKALAGLAFATPQANKTLVDITHPFILAEFLRRVDTARSTGAQLYFIDGAMIVGGIFEEHCDAIILVEAEQRLSISRIVLRDNISKTAAQQRLDAQLPPETLRAAANYTIQNNSGTEQLHAQADTLLKTLLRR